MIGPYNTDRPSTSQDRAHKQHVKSALIQHQGKIKSPNSENTLDHLPNTKCSR